MPSPDLTSKVRLLTAVRGPGGERLANALGIKPSVVEDMRKELSWVSDELGFLSRVWQERHTADDQSDDEEFEESDEETEEVGV